MRLDEGADRVVFYPQEAICVPEVMISTTLRAARALGAEVLNGAEVTRIEHHEAPRFTSSTGRSFARTSW